NGLFVCHGFLNLIFSIVTGGPRHLPRITRPSRFRRRMRPEPHGGDEFNAVSILLDSPPKGRGTKSKDTIVQVITDQARVAEVAVPDALPQAALSVPPSRQRQSATSSLPEPLLTRRRSWHALPRLNG